ncbi:MULTISPECIES: c-type cytochrome [unclassified Polaribacter]|uniref:c-type cytochrome n=1 Tax=unclassified Polaribacter TaxID=196858 RepID=UPI000068CCA1|nr:cytochrome c [Polaribacter sp. MED152]EAQ43101.1 cytochrome c1 [Polaribacter sp. MED152]
MKSLKLFIALVVFASIISCNDKRKPQLEYMPDMYVSIPYDTDDADGLNGEPVNSKPVAGTIPRGGHPAYDIPDTAEGYEKAKTELKNPLEASEANLEKGKELYNIYCISCHGKKGDGNGYLSQAEKFEGIPSYKDRDITAGSIYHVIIHGKNLMGSHSGQLTYNERWQIIHYVEQLRADLLK